MHEKTILPRALRRNERNVEYITHKTKTELMKPNKTMKATWNGTNSITMNIKKKLTKHGLL